MARFEESLRRLAILDEDFIEDSAGLKLYPDGAPSLDPITATLLRLGVSVALGSPPVCLQWAVGRALATGATDDQVTDVLVAIAPVAGLARIVAAAPDVAIALGYDLEAALEEPDGHGSVLLPAQTPRDSRSRTERAP